LPTDDVRAVVFMSWGRWVASCPRPGCTNSECFGRCDDGSTGGLTRNGFTCRSGAYGGCGLQCAAVWPADVEDIERVILARPVPATRNWLHGETVLDLVAESVQHGLIPDGGLANALMARQIGA
jgi:hypothetical protein